MLLVAGDVGPGPSAAPEVLKLNTLGEAVLDQWVLKDPESSPLGRESP